MKNIFAEKKTKVTGLNVKEQHRVSQGLAPWESMSFACGGWLQFYMYGVAKALQVHKMDKGVKYAGCSAGALAAVGLIVGGEFDDAIRFCKEYCVPHAYKDLTGLFRLSEFVAKCLEITIIPNYKSIPDGDLQIATTRLPFLTAERVTVHRSKEELIKSLLSSCAAFPLSPLIRRNNGWYIDGGLSDFQPIIDEDTITVSPFYFSDCDIKPSRYVPLWWAAAPPKDDDSIDWLYTLGYEDCVRYLESRGIDTAERASSFQSDHIKSGRKAHSFDRPGTVSMHRFLGYDVQAITHQYVAFTLDFLLLVVLILLWKPVALLLIYVELLVRIVVLSVAATLQTVWDLRPLTVIRGAVMKPYYLFMSYLMGLAFLQLAAEEAWKQRKTRTQQELMECISCVWSLSLLLRFISGGPSSVGLRKHDKLHKMSILYRVFRHII